MRLIQCHFLAGSRNSCNHRTQSKEGGATRKISRTFSHACQWVIDELLLIGDRMCRPNFAYISQKLIEHSLACVRESAQSLSEAASRMAPPFALWMRRCFPFYLTFLEVQPSHSGDDDAILFALFWNRVGRTSLRYWVFYLSLAIPPQPSLHIFLLCANKNYFEFRKISNETDKKSQLIFFTFAIERHCAGDEQKRT